MLTLSDLPKAAFVFTIDAKPNMESKYESVPIKLFVASGFIDISGDINCTYEVGISLLDVTKPPLNDGYPSITP